MRVWRKKRFFLLLLLTFLCVLFWSGNYVGRLLYPIRYMDEIQAQAKKYQLDPYLIAAIIRVESNYRTEIESRKGAYGMMQLMPETSGWIIEAGKFPPGYKELLHQPSINIELGSWYLSWLDKQFQGNMPAVIASYNAGQTNVQKWLTEGIWDGTFENATDVPFGETRHYIQRVRYYHDKYAEIYDAS